VKISLSSSLKKKCYKSKFTIIVLVSIERQEGNFLSSSLLSRAKRARGFSFSLLLSLSLSLCVGMSGALARAGFFSLSLSLSPARLKKICHACFLFSRVSLRSAHFRQQTGLFIGGHLGDVSRGPSLFGDGGDGVADGGGESHSRGESFFLFSLFVRRLVFFVRVLLFLPLLLLESRR
jgi:hypothetical protein